MFKLTSNPEYVNKLGTAEYHRIADSTEYLAWVAEGNTPDPVDPPTAEELAAQAREAADHADKTNAKSDAVIQYLVTHTPAECDAYVKANVTNLATAVNLLGKMAMALSVLARAELR